MGLGKEGLGKKMLSGIFPALPMPIDANGEVDGAALRRLRHGRLLMLFEVLFPETNPGPLKAAMRLIGLDIRRVLLPLPPPSPATIATLEAAIAGLRAAGVPSVAAQAT